MKKIKDFYFRNKDLIYLFFTSSTAILFAYLGFKRGYQKSQGALREEQIDHLKTKVSEKIMEEKLNDSKKDINEISSDIDNILDHK